MHCFNITAHFFVFAVPCLCSTPIRSPSPVLCSTPERTVYNRPTYRSANAVNQRQFLGVIISSIVCTGPDINFPLAA